MQMKKLIINADDFGISKETNLAIKQGYESGIITSTSIITNMEAFEHAVFEILPASSPPGIQLLPGLPDQSGI